MQSIDDFIENLLSRKGLTKDIPADVRKELAEDMKERLIDQINKSAILELSEAKATELAKLIEDPNFTKEQMTEFIQNSGVNLADVTLSTMLRFQNFYLGQGA